MTAFLLDSNVWLALSLQAHSKNLVAAAWWDSLSVDDTAFFNRTTQQSLLRLLTNSAVQRQYDLPPLSNSDAWATFTYLLNDSKVAFAHEPPDVDENFRRFALTSRPSTNLWTDAYLAAFATVGGYTFVTLDTGFLQFAGLDLVLLGADTTS